MKLLRFTSEDNRGIFSSTLDQELEIPANSKIALASCALEVDQDEMVIDSTNDTVTFQIVTGAERTASLQNTDGSALAGGGFRPVFYDNNNFQLLFDDMQESMNGVIGSIDAGNQIQFPSEIGKQAQVTKKHDGKVQISLNSSVSANYKNNIDKNTPTTPTLAGGNVGAKTIIIPGLAGATPGMTTTSATAQGNESYAASTFQTYPISKGCGVHRVRLKTLANQGATAARGGASISLHRNNNPSNFIVKRTTGMVVGDIDYGIKARAAFNAGTAAQEGIYTYILNGVEVQPNPPVPITEVVGAADNRKDVLSLEVVGSTIRGVVYKSDPADPTNPPLVTILFTDVYNNVDDLYASYSIHGAGQQGVGGAYGARLDTFRFTPDPYRSADNTLDTPVLDETDTVLTASTPTRQSTVQTNHFIQFEGDDLNEFLGFDNARQPLTGFTLGNRSIHFVGENSFKTAIINDCFMVEMLNLTLESYDFHESQRKRKNILAVLPFDNINNKCIFQPNTLAFLELSNKEKYMTSEVKLRIVQADYSEVTLTGLSSVVIYLD